MTTIPNGTNVFFLRPEHSCEYYDAVVKRSHRLSGEDGHHYEITCPEFPFVVGFAHDEELFVDRAAAEAAAKVARKAHVALKQQALLAERARIDAELAALGAHPDHEFKNFHRGLCERFGYVHDPKDWKRDQVSLSEHLAKLVQPKVMKQARDALNYVSNNITSEAPHGLDLRVVDRAAEALDRALNPALGSESGL